MRKILVGFYLEISTNAFYYDRKLYIEKAIWLRNATIVEIRRRG